VFEEIRKRAISVALKVFETMFYIPLELQEEGMPCLPTASVYRAEIGFRGKQSGKMRLYLPSDLARTMALNFMGLEEEEVTEAQAMDVTGEVCNMVCGNLFSELDKKTVWDLTMPQTLPVSYDEMVVGDPGAEIMVDFNAEGYAIKLNMEIEN
jgi:CheY-specific phosphatase CheX